MYTGEGEVKRLIPGASLVVARKGAHESPGLPSLRMPAVILCTLRFARTGRTSQVAPPLTDACSGHSGTLR